MSFTEGTTVFLLSVTGQVSAGHFPAGLDDLYCHHRDTIQQQKF